MELEEAMEKYRISIPSETEFYSPEYNDYFRGVRDDLRDTFEKYRPFQEMYTKSLYATFYTDGERLPNKSAKAVVLGGQTGAGKSCLVVEAKREFQKNGEGIFVIDDDMFRKFYPRAQEILQECPEYYINITATGSGPVTPKIMKYASDNHLNFIFDGTLKNPRIINTAMSWNGYSINWKIMATSKIESLLSIFERNEELRKIHSGRLITVGAHNETYDGLEPTVMELEKLSNIGRIQVYSRGKDRRNAVLQYDSEDIKNFKSAYVALRTTRIESGKRFTQAEIKDRIERLLKSEIPLNPNEIKEIEKLKTELLGQDR